MLQCSNAATRSQSNTSDADLSFVSSLHTVVQCSRGCGVECVVRAWSRCCLGLVGELRELGCPNGVWPDGDVEEREARRCTVQDRIGWMRTERMRPLCSRWLATEQRRSLAAGMRWGRAVLCRYANRDCGESGRTEECWAGFA